MLFMRKKTGKIRFKLRDMTAEKIFGIFHVTNAAGYCDLKHYRGTEDMLVRLVSDCSDGELKAEHLARTFFCFQPVDIKVHECL